MKINFMYCNTKENGSLKTLSLFVSKETTFKPSWKTKDYTESNDNNTSSFNDERKTF